MRRIGWVQSILASLAIQKGSLAATTEKNSYQQRISIVKKRVLSLAEIQILTAFMASVSSRWSN